MGTLQTEMVRIDLLWMVAFLNAEPNHRTIHCRLLSHTLQQTSQQEKVSRTAFPR